jgi:hypothetical protein
MTKISIILSAAGMALGSWPIPALADEVPTFDVRATCRVESQADPSAGTAAGCLSDEQKARETLVAQWARFAPESRTSCIEEQAGALSPRSYVELLTCLQVAQQLKDLPKE